MNAMESLGIPRCSSSGIPRPSREIDLPRTLTSYSSSAIKYSELKTSFLKGKAVVYISHQSSSVSKAPIQSPICATNEKKQREPPPVFVFDDAILRRPNVAVERDSEPKQPSFENISTPPNHKSGYVALIGRPNAGKSTLMNQFIGQKLSIVTEKPQTTRHRILGLCSGEDYQMVMFDTPGVMAKRMHKLDDAMMKNVRSAAMSADCVLLVVDIMQDPNSQQVMSMLSEAEAAAADSRPLLLALNKRDALRPGEIASKIEWYKSNSEIDDVVAISAKYGHGCEELKQLLLSKLPLGPAYYPKDIVSEHPERFFVAEIVREKLMMQYRQELPYVCQVNVAKYIERDTRTKDFVEIEIVVERDSQKAILLGKEGRSMKILATAARKDIEDFVCRPVFLEIRVKVKDNWRQNETLVKDYGIDGSKMF